MFLSGSWCNYKAQVRRYDYKIRPSDSHFADKWLQNIFSKRIVKLYSKTEKSLQVTTLCDVFSGSQINNDMARLVESPTATMTWRWSKTHKIPPRMHQNPLFPDQKTKQISGEGALGRGRGHPLPSPHLTPRRLRRLEPRAFGARPSPLCFFPNSRTAEGRQYGEQNNCFACAWTDYAFSSRRWSWK